MKILFVCENYIPHYGGVEVVFKNLAERLVQKGHSVTLITHLLKGTKRKEIMNGVVVKRISSLNSRYIFSFASIPSVLKEAKKHDIIQTTTFNGTFPAWIASIIRKKPVALTVHEIWQGRWQEVTGFSWWKSKIHELFERGIYFMPFDRYICVSNSTKKDCTRLLTKKESRITRVYNGLDYDYWNKENVTQQDVQEVKSKVELLNNNNNNNNKELFFYLSWGRPGASKGFASLINAVPLILKKVPNAHLILMLGTAEKYKEKYVELINLINSLRLNDNITIIPSLPYKYLRTLITQVDCVVIPSLAEGFGYTTAETVAMETPVITSDAGSLIEVVGGKHLVFRRKDRIDLAEKVVMAANGNYQYKKEKRFLWEEAVEQYENIYQQLTDSNLQQLSSTKETRLFPN